MSQRASLERLAPNPPINSCRQGLDQRLTELAIQTNEAAKNGGVIRASRIRDPTRWYIPRSFEGSTIAERKIAPNLPDWMVEHPKLDLASAETGSLQRNQQVAFSIPQKLAPSKTAPKAPASTHVTALAGNFDRFPARAVPIESLALKAFLRWWRNGHVSVRIVIGNTFFVLFALESKTSSTIILL